jgi:hypothetical protein
MRSDPTLKRYYRELNKKWFKGELPASTKCVWGPISEHKQNGKGSGAMAFCESPTDDDPFFLISFDPRLKKLNWWNLVRSTMIHEMVHVWTKNRDSHGPVFEAKMRELANAGAFKKRSKRMGPIW